VLHHLHRGHQGVSGAAQADVDLAIDIMPLRAIPEAPHQLLEMPSRVPAHIRTSSENQRFSEFPAVVQAPGDSRQIVRADADRR